MFTYIFVGRFAILNIGKCHFGHMLEIRVTVSSCLFIGNFGGVVKN